MQIGGNRGVPSAAEFEHAVRDLSGAGLMLADGVQVSLTDSGLALWRRGPGPEVRKGHEWRGSLTSTRST